MAYGNYGANSYDMNEAAKRQAEAQRQAMEQQRIQQERQAYERARQAFQEQIVAQEQSRRQMETQEAAKARQMEISEKTRQMETMAKTIGGLGNSFAASNLQQQPGAPESQPPQMSIHDHNGNRIGGSYPPPGQGNQPSYGRGGMSPFRQSLLGS